MGRYYLYRQLRRERRFRSMEAANVKAVETLKLPENRFTAPQYQKFKAGERP